MDKYEEYINEVERLFEENKPKEAEKLLLAAYAGAEKDEDFGLKLQLLNELIGYYRQTSEKKQLLEVIGEALKVADDMGLMNSANGKIAYATTLLNAANGYRSIGELEASFKCYSLVSDIYNASLDKNDMLIAGLYNNMSLLYQEKGDFETAMEYLHKALEISENNGAYFEIAVTYANLANTAVAAVGSGNPRRKRLLEEAFVYANEAIRRFEERNTIDAHYSAALSALGMCSYYEKDYRSARRFFEKGMDIVSRCLGHNAQYMRLKENRDMCLDKYMTGLKLARLYYEECVRPMLENEFPKYLPHMAAGLVGEGSECLGFDDDFSTDHDCGPHICLWLTDEVYNEIGEKLKEAYQKLPKEFKGYTRSTTRQGDGRRGVMRISDFYARYLNTSEYDKIDWRNIDDYSLLSASNGEVFTDEAGIFTQLREKLLTGYPEDILYLKLAQDMAGISQTGQYNYQRMIKRGDRVTADLMLNECIKTMMLLAHHMENKYPPHDKWLYRSTADINGAVIGFIDKLHGSLAMKDDEAAALVEDIMEQVGDYFARQLYSGDIISDIESYLDYHTDELLRKASYSRLKKEELVDKIARLEFEAFDKVKNEGGRASCQNDWPTFSIMRKSQYLTWNRTMLIQYLYDFAREYELGHNLITEKYGRMMESTAPEEYKAIEKNFEVLSPQKKAIVEQIVAIQVGMLEEFGRDYPNTAGNARSFHTYEDNYVNTSYETYLRGEISTYSDKMIVLYGRFAAECAANGRNIARLTIENTAKLYGYKDLDEFEAATGAGMHS